MSTIEIEAETEKRAILALLRDHRQRETELLESTAQGELLPTLWRRTSLCADLADDTDTDIFWWHAMNAAFELRALVYDGIVANNSAIAKLDCESASEFEVWVKELSGHSLVNTPYLHRDMFALLIGQWRYCCAISDVIADRLAKTGRDASLIVGD